MTNAQTTEFIPLMELPLTNGFLFGETMYDAETSRTALEIILGMEIAEVILVNKEQHLDVDGIHKGIRLDIFVKDTKGCIYNVEMQTDNRYNIPKRSRHYQSVIDIKLLPAGEIDYNKLNDTIIIFICTFDLFGQNRYLYEFENRCTQDTSLCLKDGTRKVYLNTHGTNDSEVSPELIEFLHMLENPQLTNIQSPKVQKIYNRVKTVKQDSQVEARYMRELTYEKELIEKGIEKGIEQGISQERKLLIEKKLAKGQTMEQIAEALELDIDTIKELMKNI